MINEVLGVETISWKKKVNEDDELIKLVDDFFFKKRGYVARIPEPNTPVLACLSGGQDSVATIAILLEEFKLQVYPFFVNRHQSNYLFEKKSVEYYDHLFKNKYPELYKPSFEINIDAPSLSYKNLLTKQLRANHIGYPARNSMLFLAGAEYAYGLTSRGIKINTIFGAAVGSDSLYHSSLTWTRITNLAICQMLHDYNWQLISLALEKELGNQYDKDTLIKYCAKRDIPLQYTRTCVEPSETQCGKCICCYDRRRCFKLANVKDRTEYLYPFPAFEPEH